MSDNIIVPPAMKAAHLKKLVGWAFSGLLLVTANLGNAAYPFQCKQSGSPLGTMVCAPFTQTGPWHYFLGISGGYCPQGEVFYYEDGSLANVTAKFAADMNDWYSRCTDPNQWVTTIASCSAPPRTGSNYVVPPDNHIVVVPAGPCNELLGNVVVTDQAQAFRLTPPYCAPNGHLLFTDNFGTNSKEPLMCAYRPDPKDLGDPACGIGVGNPINVATGNKFQREEDYVGTGPFPLRLTRYYNSFDIGREGAQFGIGWRGEYQRAIEYFGDGGQALAFAYRANGKVLTFKQSGAMFIGDADLAERLYQDIDGWRLVDENDTVERYSTAGRLLSITNRTGAALTMGYDAQGRLSSVTDPLGRQLGFSYDARSRATTATDPSGRTYLYEYNTRDAISGVGYPDGKARVYVYNEQAYTTFTNLPYALTGIIDENGARFASFRYNSAGQVVSTSHIAGGLDVNTYTVTYATQSATVIDPLGTTRVHSFQTIAGSAKSTGISQPCQSCGTSSSTIALDATTGYPTMRVDFRNGVTTYQRSASGGRVDLETQRTEALYTPQARTITTTWHPTFRLPSTIAEPAPGGTKTTTYSYDASGNLTQKQIVAPKNDGTAGTISRTWTWTYASLGRVLTATDSNNRVTTYTYYADNDADATKRGNVHTISNPLAHVTQITSYDGNGRPLTIIDPNGLSTTLVYDERGRLTTRSVGGEQTSYAYDGVGQLKAVTLPDLSTLTYFYDSAHRLTEIRDGLGNKVVYSLDAAGNRTREQAFDVSGTLARTRSWVYDDLNRVSQSLGALTQATIYGYDGNGNRTTTTDPLTHATTNTYDALNRLIEVLDPAGGRTTYQYDAVDNLTQVTDPRGLATTYTYDGLGNRIRQMSPDTGLTTNGFDAVGNLLVRTDAVGNVASFTIDGMNRVSNATFSRAGSPNEVHTYTYDTGTYGKGRLAQLADPAATTTWTYTLHGRVASKSQIVSGVTRALSFGYNAAGQLATMTTPSGQQITYTYANNRPLTVRVNGTLLVGGVIATPFGALGAWQWGNGLYTFRDYDQDGRLASWSFRNGTTLLRNDITFDTASRITGIANPIQSTLSGAYSYDVSDRLTLAQQGSPVTRTLQYSYDGVGNRTSTNINGTAATLSYSAGNNQLISVTGSSPAGYLAGATDVTFEYNNAHRLTGVKSSGVPLATYSVNGLGQRVKKVFGGGTTLFVYDDSGHLVGEYDGAGNLVQETIWLEDLPIATLRPTGTGTPTPVAIYYVHADHLGTPRAVTRPTDNSFMWRWDNTDPFGANASNENPVGQGTFKYALRFPGQYFDGELGMVYNSFRDYDSAIGRYTRSDPMGIDGGTNTYAYVDSTPVSAADPLGLLAVHGSCAAFKSSIAWAENEVKRSLGTCLNCNSDKEKLLRKLETATVFCAGSCKFTYESGRVGDVDAHVIWPNDFLLTSCGLRGCIAATILHELTHLIGYHDEDMPRRYEQECINCAPKNRGPVL